MNIFRSIIGKVWQDPNAAEVVKISSGQLFLTRAGILRSNRECIYNEAMATIRRIPQMDHNFQLVITRVYEDEDQGLLAEDDETDEERVFLVGEELDFRPGETDGEPTFIWRDLQGDVDELFEFVCPDTNAPTRAFFETCMYRAMFERKYKRSADMASEAALDEFVCKPPPPKAATPQISSRKASPSTRNISSAPVPPSQQPQAEPEPIAEATAMSVEPSAPRESLGLTPTPLPNAETIHSFDHSGIVTAQIVRGGSGYDYYLSAATSDGHLLLHKIASELNQRCSKKMRTLTWNHMGDNGVGHSWLFRFENDEDYQAFISTFMSCLWETTNQTSWAKIKADEQDYVMRSANDEDVEMKDVEDSDEDEDAVQSALDPDEEPSDDEEEDEEPASEDEDDLKQPPGAKGDRNSQLTVGYKGDRSYVVRGNNIGVFSHDHKNSIKYYATISNIATPKGKGFKPRHVMLHDQDSKMILMNPQDPNSLYSMDIERGKVVEEWKVHDDIPVLNIAPENKFAPTTLEKTLVGTSGNALFRIDPRVSAKYKQYVSKNKFSGVLAVASEKGDIRLFDSIGKNAKTALPPLGDPIIGIDVTADGRWIVATTKTYLLLIDTLIGEGRYSGQLGFDRSFPANAKPLPKRLQLKPEHVAFMGNNVSFTVAKFNQGEGQTENAIVTSTGPFVIAWDFGKVKKGFNDKYEIKKYEDHVVQDNFKFGDDKEIIVALDNNVLAINKKNLKRPTRQSLAPPTAGYSRSNIVNSPY
ncbi:VID27 cytoplasmic protein [Ephemerocybe angulata]|uniref:VID27 cytoplasmic protein n=1 Tax=Ephemerocybe angulata TaxID=980116 RepID=A0A8H6IDB2_9AGAR|nr:VID27 cytoplasmic protein [Tulosesus angulatus]